MKLIDLKPALVAPNKQVRKTRPSVRKSSHLLDEKLVYNGFSEDQTKLKLTRYDETSIYSASFETVGDLLAELRDDQTNWIHVCGLRDVDMVDQLCRHFGLQIPVVQDILNVSHISKIEETNNLLLVILDAYKYDEAYQLTHDHLSFILGKNVVISFEEARRDRFNLVNKALESSVGLIRSQKADYLLNLLISLVVDSYLEVLEVQQNNLMDLEDTMLEFNVALKEPGQEIQHFRKDYSRIKRSVSPLREDFGHLLLMESSLIGKNSLIYYRDTNDHLQQVFLTLEANRETLASLVDLYLANNDLHMNQIMKQLTVVSTIFIPLTFMVGVWGMNFKVMPELGWQYGYVFAWGVMLVLGLVFYFWLRRKRMF